MCAQLSLPGIDVRPILRTWHRIAPQPPYLTEMCAPDPAAGDEDGGGQRQVEAPEQQVRQRQVHDEDSRRVPHLHKVNMAMIGVFKVYSPKLFSTLI